MRGILIFSLILIAIILHIQLYHDKREGFGADKYYACYVSDLGGRAGCAYKAWPEYKLVRDRCLRTTGGDGEYCDGVVLELMHQEKKI